MNTPEETRWEKYREANLRFPHVRQSELLKQLALTDPQRGETIVEIGPGNGFLTFKLAQAVGNEGQIIVYDTQAANLRFIEEANQGRLPITTVHQGIEHELGLTHELDLPDESVDKVSHIAALHHYDDRSRNTGTSGREGILQELYRVLRKGGKLIIGDCADGTAPQRYFDAIDNPTHCHPRGHPHDFPDEQLARTLCEQAGFTDITFEIASVPWAFEDEAQAQTFLHTLHNATCTPEESLAIAKQHLPFTRTDGKKQIGWELFYLTARK